MRKYPSWSIKPKKDDNTQENASKSIKSRDDLFEEKAN